MARRQRRDLSVFESSSHLPICLLHTMEASHCPFNCWTSSREPVNTNFYNLWFDSTGNRTRVYLGIRSLASKPQVLENCPVLGSRTALFFEQLKFRWKTPETSWKICEHLFCFPQLEHRRRQGREAGPPVIVISPMEKMWQKSLFFLQF